MAQPTRTTSNTGTSQAGESSAPKKKKHRGGKKKRNNRAKNENGEQVEVQGRPSLLDAPTRSHQSQSFYRLGRNASNTSLESEALLDHREHGQVRNRRSSIGQSGGFTRPSIPFARHRGSTTSGPMANYQRSRLAVASGSAVAEEDEGGSERTPLLSNSSRTHSRPEIQRANSGNKYGTSHRSRRQSANSKASSRRRLNLDLHPSREEDEDYDVNNPPSRPTSPKLGSLDDMMIDELPGRAEQYDRGRDAVIDIDGDDRRSSDFSPEALRRRATVADLAERDVCFPGDGGMSEIGEDDRQSLTESSRRRRRRRARQWPDLEILEDWSREEKEERTHQEHVRSKKINEPVLVGGRLRPGRTVWHREEDEEPFRFTYFNETYDGTIHARTISDLCQDGTSFKDLFLPDPVELSDDSDDDEEDIGLRRRAANQEQNAGGLNGRITSTHSKPPTIAENGEKIRSPPVSENHTRSNTPSAEHSHSATPRPGDKAKRYGARPTFWLDVLQPTDLEMKVIAKAFGIHQLTTEDILMDEEREKVELFQNYYFVNYRSFEQDKDSEDYMDPINFYAVVFRDGVITFHHSMTPHPANVRRRIRQLNDYMSPTADWISYAIIDDITDVYTPRVSQIEQDVDTIDEEILYMHTTSADSAEGNASSPGDPNSKKGNSNEKNSGGAQSEAGGDKTAGQLGGDMLRRVGESRKKVQSLHRLLGNKADVIKGFAKRCNEGWEVAPRSEIGLYLGDIQDHIVTMSSNLAHYES